MGSVMIRCPTTGSAISTGIETEESVLRQLPKITVRVLCPVCGQEHAWSKDVAWVTPQASLPPVRHAAA